MWKTRRSRAACSTLILLMIACAPAETPHLGPVAPMEHEMSGTGTPAAGERADAGRTAGPAVPLKREGAYANLDPADDFVVGPPDALPECDADLAKAGVTYKPASLPVHTQGKAK